MQILTNLDLKKNTVDNVVFKPLTSAPENPKMGQVYYNSTDKKQYQFDGTEWKPMGGSEGSMYEVIATEAQTDTEAIATVDAKPKKSDTCIVKRLIAEGKYAYTAYLYDGKKWGAMDGNYSAKNVYFDSNILLTANMGVQKIDSTGSKELPTIGKSMQDVMTMFTTEEAYPTKVTAPAVTVVCPEAKVNNTNNRAYEVGTEVTPTYTATLSAGSYPYGPATGIVASAWTITDTNGGSQTSELAKATGSFDKFTVEDNTNYTITAVATHGDGTIPLTNTKNEYPNTQIKAGTKTGTSAKISGYRNAFYGTKTTKEGTVNSDYIRTGLTTSGKALVAKSTFTVNIPVGAMRVVIAYPATLQDVTSIKDVNGMNAEIKSGFTKSTVSVEGANGYTAKDYKVYIMDYAKANDKANTYSVTI